MFSFTRSLFAKSLYEDFITTTINQNFSDFDTDEIPDQTLWLDDNYPMESRTLGSPRGTNAVDFAHMERYTDQYILKALKEGIKRDIANALDNLDKKKPIGSRPYREFSAQLHKEITHLLHSYEDVTWLVRYEVIGSELKQFLNDLTQLIPGLRTSVINKEDVKGSKLTWNGPVIELVKVFYDLKSTAKNHNGEPYLLAHYTVIAQFIEDNFRLAGNEMLSSHTIKTYFDRVKNPKRSGENKIDNSKSLKKK